MEIVLCNGFGELSTNEIEQIEGGKWYDAVLAFGGGIATTVGVCGIVSGSGTAIASMGVASLAACGPAGWAVLGIAAVGAAATGAATVAAAKR